MTALSWPSLTTSATSTLPVCPDAAAIVNVRFAPLPPRTRPELGKRASSVVKAVTTSEPALVCPSPTVTASGAEAIPLVTVAVAGVAMVGTVFPANASTPYCVNHARMIA